MAMAGHHTTPHTACRQTLPSVALGAVMPAPVSRRGGASCRIFASLLQLLQIVSSAGSGRSRHTEACSGGRPQTPGGRCRGV